MRKGMSNDCGQQSSLRNGIVFHNPCNGQLMSCPLHCSVRQRKQQGPWPSCRSLVKLCPLIPFPFLHSFWISPGVTECHNHKTCWSAGECLPHFKVHEIMWMLLCSLVNWQVFSLEQVTYFHTFLCGIRTSGSLEIMKMFGLCWRTLAWRRR